MGGSILLIALFTGIPFCRCSASRGKMPKSHSQAPRTKVCGAFLRSAAVKVTALSPGKAKETTWHCPPFVVKYHGI
ncbi:MAG: hypothetical protein V8S77_01970 [Oscillospiraceae bacterium]